jgi:hypothetical protein
MAKTDARRAAIAASKMLRRCHKQKPTVSEGVTSSRKYRVLRGRIVATAEERGDQQPPHCRIMVVADGEPWRVAVNVKSTASYGGPDRAMVL